MSGVAGRPVADADVIVIGAGHAGLRAALSAARAGTRVIIASKAPEGQGGVSHVAIGAAAAFPEEGHGDSPDAHFADTMTGGHLLSDSNLVTKMAWDARARLLEMEDLGASLGRTEQGRLVLKQMPGHRYPRSVANGMRLGAGITSALIRALGQFPQVSFRRLSVTDLLVTEAGCYGCDAQTPDGDQIVVRGKAVVLATGGGHAIYGRHSYPAPDLTGDGYAMALRAGLELRDMEFVQFFPTALVWPPEFAGLLWVGQLRYLCGAWLTNKYGQRFMADHDRDRMELATRDTVARAIASEVIEGRGSPHGGVWMSVAHLGRNQVRAFLEETFPGGAFRTGELEQTGIDLTTDSLEVAPTAHFFNGGVVIDESCRTTIPGLFAAGEVVGGLHGANRIEDNAITEALVFGAIAGDAAAEYANRCDDAPLFEGSPPVRRTSSDPAWCDQTASAIGSRMWLAAGPVRSTATLAETADWLRDVRDDAGRRCAREIESMATLGEVITRSALARPASMGAHYLIDSVAEEDSMGTTFASLDDQIHVERRKSPSLVSRPERALA